MVDSGATKSCISPKIVHDELKEDQVSFDRFESVITVANGDDLYAHEVAKLCISVDGNIAVDFEFVVAELADENLILGYDFQRENHMYFDMDNEIFKMKEEPGVPVIEAKQCCKDQLVCRHEVAPNKKPEYEPHAQVAQANTSDERDLLEQERSRLSQINPNFVHKNPQVVVAGEDVVIPDHTESIFPGVLQGPWNDMKGSIVVEGSESFSEKHGVKFARIITEPASQIRLRVMNLSGSEVVFHKGAVLAEYEEVDSIGGQIELPDNPAEQNEMIYNDMIKKSTEGLNSYQKGMAESFLQNSRDNFITHTNDLGHSNIFPHKIDTGDARPIHQAPRRLPMSKKQVAEKEVQRMLDMGIIEPSTSPWSSPIVLVNKKTGDVRFCIDFRKVNDVTKKDSFPLPRVDDSLTRLSGSSWFSTMDLASGYWQVAMDEQDAEKTAFITENGLYQFKVLPFGLCNAGATFQRLMQLALSGLSWEMVLVYIDDLIVHSKTFEEHIGHLKEVFEKLRAAGLKMSPKKCDFFRREVTFLGHIVSEQGIKTDPSKITAINEWPQPTTVKDVQAFLGLCGYYRKFIKGFAQIAQPMYPLFKKDVTFVWSDGCQEAFDKLKKSMIESPILAYPQPEGQFILDTDASNFAIGVVLSQVQNGQEKVILYYSKSLSKAEKNYCVTRRELLAVVMGVQHCHHYLLGNKFKVRTDHGSLRWLMNFKNPEAQTARWLNILSKYDFEIEFRQGVKHGNADGLSRRRPCESEGCRKCARVEEIDESHRIAAFQIADPLLDDFDESWVEGVTEEEIIEMQRDDSNLSEVIKWLQQGFRPPWSEVKKKNRQLKSLWHEWKNLLMKKQLLCHKNEQENDQMNKVQLVAPISIRYRLFSLLHHAKLGGHQGIVRTVASIKQRFWWPLLQDDVQRWCNECLPCQERKKGRQKAFPLQQYVACNPLERIGMDILSFSTESDTGNSCALVICDYFSKFCWAVALKDHKAITVADALVHNVFLPMGLATYIHSDQGREFQSELLKKLSEMLQIGKTRTCPYRPQSDGLVERFNRTCLDMLAKLCDGNPADWDQHLPFVISAYNATPHASTGCTPNLLMLNRETTMPIDLIFPIPKLVQSPICPIAYVEWVKEQIQTNFEFARKELGKAAVRQKKNYDAVACPRSLEIGQMVWRLYPPAQIYDKLNPRNIGPYKIVENKGNGTYAIQGLKDDKSIVVHIDHLKEMVTSNDVNEMQDGEMQDGVTADGVLQDGVTADGVLQDGVLQDGVMLNDAAQERQKNFSDLQVGGMQKKPDGELSVADDRPQLTEVLTQRGRKIRRPKHLDNYVM